MGFAVQAKGEAARVMPEGRCCQEAELAGYVQASPVHRDDALRVVVEARHPAVARKLLVLSRRRFGWTPRIRGERGPGRRMIQLELADPGEAGWRRLMDWPGDAEVGSCCRAAFLRGAFLAAGYLIDPRKGYHLEWVLPTAAAASTVEALLAAEGIASKTMRRKGLHVVYLKEADAISDVLSMMGTHHALFQFEDVRVMKGVRNEVNRLVNAETANVNKAVGAALKQVEAIKRLHRQVGLSNLPSRLRAVAEARLAFPYASLKELGERMDPPLSKSALGYRMRRLMDLAEQETGAGRNWARTEEVPRRRAPRRDRRTGGSASGSSAPSRPGGSR